ncbi:BchE/P-methylase family protein [Olavius algarvensis associated proteobacterium Delta 3]|nr:BchE/P-methylase family protein [Olavius algarvensis associated proteobacterium Delta 3]
MKLELISPFRKGPRNVGNAFHFPQMALGILASLTPSDVDVSITDELVQPIDLEKEVDLVGITVNTKTAVRAYEIADAYRSRGVSVVLGGIHPTVAKEEALMHASTLVLGEAEDVWSTLLEDFKNGKLKKLYRSDKLPNPKHIPHPRRQLFQEHRYVSVNLVQTSRGCPYSCDFCSVSSLYGNGVRLRPVDSVIAEVKHLSGNKLMFVDDNIVAVREHSKQLLGRLASLNKKWIGQTSINVADDDKMLKRLNRGGCLGLFVGLETTSTEGLKTVGKYQNINNDYIESVKKLHDNGIAVLGAFILGLDSDDESCFDRLLEFSLKSKIDVIQPSILAPYPATAIYSRLKEENRLIDDSWWLRYNADDVVYRPNRMTRVQLYEGWVRTMKELYKLRFALKRCLDGFSKRSLFGNILNWKGNMGYRKLAYAKSEKSPGRSPARHVDYSVESHVHVDVSH